MLERHEHSEKCCVLKAPTHGRVRRLAFAAIFSLGLAACGSELPSPVPAPVGAPPPSSAGDKPTPAEASRFLTQATFGPTEGSINELVSMGYSEWMRRQLTAPTVSNVEEVRRITDARQAVNDGIGASVLAEVSWKNMIDGEDQLRQRMMFALSQILVLSYDHPDTPNTPLGVAYYMDVLNRNAFGNYRTLLEDVTYSPSMAVYLTYLNNSKEDLAAERVPDENYAREVMQLFSIGLVMLNKDGTPQLDSQGAQIETYTNDDITGLAKVFTGLSWDHGIFGQNRPIRDVPAAASSPMAIYPEHHTTTEKSFLGVTIPANTDAATSIDIALDTLFNHQNIAPFISRQLIQRFVTSNPSPRYVTNVASAFETGWYQLPDGSTIGSQARADLSAVIAAILLDDEARNLANRDNPNFGKVREPVIRFTHWARNAGLNSTSIHGDAPLGGSLGGHESLRMADDSMVFAQHPFRSPSVFNFYRPGYVAAGSQSASAELSAPELQIMNSATVIGFANYMQSRIDQTRTDLTFLPSYAPELALADNPEALVDRLNLLMTAGAMTPETRAAIIAAVNDITMRSDSFINGPRLRVNVAMLMTTLSPEYTVQR